MTGAEVEGAQVRTTFFTRHRHDQQAGGIIGTVAMIFLVFFIIALYGRVRDSAPMLGAGMLVGGALAALAFTSVITFEYILGKDAANLTAGSAATLNLLQDDFVLPAALGMAVFGIVGGLAVVASRAPGRTMGWVLFVLGCCSVSPLLFFAILAIAIWCLVAGIWLTVRGPKTRVSSGDGQLLLEGASAR